MRFMAMLVLALTTLTPMLAESPRSASATATVSVRIRSAASAGYDPASELVLRGTVAAAQTGSLRLQLGFGTVTVDLGGASPAVTVGEAVAVTVSRVSEANGQRFVARELHSAQTSQLFRDAQGVPVGR